MSPALAGEFFTTELPGKPIIYGRRSYIVGVHIKILLTTFALVLLWRFLSSKSGVEFKYNGERKAPQVILICTHGICV